MTNEEARVIALKVLVELAEDTNLYAGKRQETQDRRLQAAATIISFTGAF